MTAKTNNAPPPSWLSFVPGHVREVVPPDMTLPDNVDCYLHANELAYSLPKQLQQSLMESLAQTALERYPDPSCTDLRSVLSQVCGVAADNIVVGNGSDELIWLLCSLFVGDSAASVVVPTPTFGVYASFARRLGLDVIDVPLTQSFDLPSERIKQALDKKPRLCFLAMPNNPTGNRWSDEVVLELAGQYQDTIFVVDEAYHLHAGKPFRIGKEYFPCPDNVVVLRTLSKIGMAGLRIGYSIAGKPITGLLNAARAPYNVGSLAQSAAAWLLVHGRSWIEERCQQTVAEREALVGQLTIRSAELGFREVFPSDANFVLVRCHSRTETTALWQKLVDNGILVRKFRSGNRQLADCLRITVGTPQQNQRLLTVLTTL